MKRSIHELVKLYNETSKVVCESGGSSVSVRLLDSTEISENQKIARAELEEYTKAALIDYILRG